MSNIINKINEKWESVSLNKRLQIKGALSASAVLLLVFSLILDYQNKRMESISSQIPYQAKAGFFVGCMSALQIIVPLDKAIEICKNESENYIGQLENQTEPMEE